ncbi:unnamed protein product [Merluccius merluccius]
MDTIWQNVSQLEGPCSCPCPTPPVVNSTEAAAAENCCNNKGRFRYNCEAGMVRKAGTSNLVTCSYEKGQPVWSPSDLVCIAHGTSVRATEPPAGDTGQKSTTREATYRTTGPWSTAPGTPETVPSTHVNASLPTSPGLRPTSTRPTQGVPWEGRGDLLQTSSSPGGELNHTGTPDTTPSKPKSGKSSGAAVPAGLGFCLWKR